MPTFRFRYIRHSRIRLLCLTFFSNIFIFPNLLVLLSSFWRMTEYFAKGKILDFRFQDVRLGQRYYSAQ